MGAETPEMQPGQEVPEGAKARQCPVNGLRSVPSCGTLFLGPRSSFWVAGQEGAHSFCCSSRRVTGQSLGPFHCSQRPPCWNVRVQENCVSMEQGLHENPGQVSTTQGWAAVSASQEAGWGRHPPAQACLQGQVLTEVSVPPQFHFSLFPCAKLSNPSRAGGSRTLDQAGEQKEAQSPSGDSCRSAWKRPEGYLV